MGRRQSRGNMVISGLTQGVIYTIVSSGEQEKEGISLPAQLSDCRRYVTQHGWAIAGEFQDVMRGTRDDRPGYQAMLEEVRRLRAGGHDLTVTVKWLHRLGRKLAESVRCRDELRVLGIPIHSIMEGGEVSDLVANVMASIAQYEVEQLGERIREVNGHLRNIGWKVVGRVAWGYRWRDATVDERACGAPRRVLEPDEQAAPYVVEMFRRVAAGHSAIR